MSKKPPPIDRRQRGSLAGVLGKKERREVMRVVAHALASALRNVVSVDVATLGFDPVKRRFHREVTIRLVDYHWGDRPKRRT